MNAEAKLCDDLASTSVSSRVRFSVSRPPRGTSFHGRDCWPRTLEGVRPSHAGSSEALCWSLCCCRAVTGSCLRALPHAVPDTNVAWARLTHPCSVEAGASPGSKAVPYFDGRTEEPAQPLQLLWGSRGLPASLPALSRERLANASQHNSWSGVRR